MSSITTGSEAELAGKLAERPRTVVPLVEQVSKNELGGAVVGHPGSFAAVPEKCCARPSSLATQWR